VKKLIGIGLIGTFFWACSDPSIEKPPTVGDPCVIDNDCWANVSNLVCRDEVCVLRQTSDMGGNNDMDSPDSDSPDMNVPIVPETFYVSFIMEDLLDNRSRSLNIIDTGTGTKTRISPDGYDCSRGCWISDDLTKFYALNTNSDVPGTFDVVESSVTALKASTDFTMIISAARSVRVVGDRLTYIRESGGVNTAYYWDGTERPVGVIGTTESTQGDWFISPQTNHAVTYRATLQTMDISVGDLNSAVDIGDKVYTINAENYQEVAGSYFGGNVPTAISPDGKRMAMVTSSAPLDTNSCTNASDCTGPGERCGRFGRCASIKIAVHLFDMDKLDNLGSPCSGNAACGPIHVCDIPSDTQLDQAFCIPRPVVLGLPGQQTQGTPARPGCELTAGREDLFYTSLRSPINFGPDGNLYVTVDRDCNDFNIPAAGILKIDPTNGSKSMVYGNRTENYDFFRCFNDVENRPDVTNCVTYIDSALLSPAGNQIAFLATNPEVIDPSLAKSTLDIWLVRRDGASFDWIGNHGELQAVRAIRIHPK